MIYNNVLELIGKTPVLKLNNFNLENAAEVFVKLEKYNPGGSVESVVEESALESDDKELNSDNTTAVFTLTCTYLVSELQQPVMNNAATETDSTQTTGSRRFFTFGL